MHGPHWSLRLGVALALAAAVGLYALVDPASSPIFPRCLLHAATGWSCPGCGGQRALHALLHGDLPAALAANALALVVLPLAGIHLLRWLSGRGAGGPLSALGRSRRAALTALGVVLAFAIGRNLLTALGT